jgi:hypothetical protein
VNETCSDQLSLELNMTPRTFIDLTEKGVHSGLQMFSLECHYKEMSRVLSYFD